MKHKISCGFILLPMLSIIILLLGLTIMMMLDQGTLLRLSTLSRTDTTLTLALANLTTIFSENLQELPVNCFIQPISPQQLKLLPDSWWQTHACTGTVQGLSYFYVGEILALDPCAMNANASAPQPGAIFYRLNLLLWLEEGRIRRGIQLIVALPKPGLNCHLPYHTLTFGRLSTREW